MEDSVSPRKAVRPSRGDARGGKTPSSKPAKETSLPKGQDCARTANRSAGQGRAPAHDEQLRDASRQSGHGAGRPPGAHDPSRARPRRLSGRTSPGERAKPRPARPHQQQPDAPEPSQGPDAAGAKAAAPPLRPGTEKPRAERPQNSTADSQSARATSDLKDSPGEDVGGRAPESVAATGPEEAVDEQALTSEQQLGLKQAEERLVRDYIHRLLKRSLEYPNFQYLCTLCSVHMENIQGAHKHIKEKRHKKNIMEKQEENELRALPPPSPAQLRAVDAAVMAAVHQQGISEDDCLLRQDIVSRMEKIIQQQLSACSLRLYGSCLTKFAFKTSDVNIDVAYPCNMTQPDVLIQVLEILKNSSQFTEVESDFHAKVPVVFCRDASSGLLCKVSAGNDVACLTTDLLAALGKLEPRLVPLVLAFRYWAKLCHIDCQAEGGIPSYSFALMVVFFLQQRKEPILPVYLGSWIEGFDVKRVDEYHLTGVKVRGAFVGWEHKPPPSGEGRTDGKAKAEPKKPVGRKSETGEGSGWPGKASEGLTRLTDPGAGPGVCLGQLWLELLRFYTLEFSLEEHIISIRLRELLSREAKSWPRRRLAIEDPFALKRNVARSLNSQMVFEYIQERFRTAYKYFACPQSKDRLARGRQRGKKASTKGGAAKVEGILGEAEGGAQDQEDTDPGVQETEEEEASEEEEDDGDDEAESNEDDPSVPGRPDRSPAQASPGSPARDRPSCGSSPSTLPAPQGTAVENGLLGSEEEEEEERPARRDVVEIAPEALHYIFDRMIFTGGKPPTVVCSICKRDGHLKDECPEDFKKIELKPLPPMTDHFRQILDGLCRLCYNELSPLPVEQQKREQILASLERFIRKEYNEKARLCLFGSSKNGFGFRDSDLDICMTLEGHDTAEKLNCKEIIEGLAKVLKKHTGLRNILPITTAKVPIVKFEHRQSGLEGDISLYNTLAQHNTRMLATYAAIDPRVQFLGYTMKVFAKRCDIGDASRGSLSSYAYILMVLYFLQQRRPPVIPVLQEIFDGKTVPQKMVDGWNAFFFDDIEELRRRIPELGRNCESVGELWLGLLRFYTEEFDFKEHVISIRQRKRLTTFEKQWTSKCIAIEDPFDLNHNLGAGVSRKMTNFIMKAFINGRKLFGTPFYPQPGLEADYFFDSKVLTDGELAPNDRCCRICGKIGHYMKDCPKRRRIKKKENDKEEDVKEEEREPRERRCFQCGDTGHVRRDCPEYRQLRQKSVAGPVPQMVRTIVSSQSIPVPQAGVVPQDRSGRIRQSSECSDMRQTPPYSPQATPFSQGSSQPSSSPQTSHIKAPGPHKTVPQAPVPVQAPHPQVQLPLFNFPHPGQYHPGLPALSMHHPASLASTSWPIHGPVIQTTAASGPHPSPPGLGFPMGSAPANGNGAGSPGNPSPMGLNDPSIIFAQPAGRDGHWHNHLAPGALVGNGTPGKTDQGYQGQFGKMTPAWEQGGRAPFSLPPSWSYRMPQGLLQQGSGPFQQNKPFISQGSMMHNNQHFPLLPHGRHVSLNYIQQKK
ncbi:terminal uridylyltransferase 4 [Anguilla anguilla]|uniref:terminal uridylyltransferase 4 n=1 Tax=Anguilla anguilla TaxID=7936 RepID=UPI0015B0D4B6|nr:terminal uridylyltransferase 4 [Anguilla anguilla]